MQCKEHEGKEPDTTRELGQKKAGATARNIMCRLYLACTLSLPNLGLTPYAASINCAAFAAACAPRYAPASSRWMKKRGQLCSYYTTELDHFPWRSNRPPNPVRCDPRRS